MKYYFAPLEGLTDSIYRKLHHKYFPGIDRYYTPFLSPTVHRSLTPKESREIPPAEILGYRCVPQLLTRDSDNFLWMARKCADLGYDEINLNLGCPSGTVTAKGKGSAMLADPDFLDQFLDRIFSSGDLRISIKTRIGFHNTELLPTLVDIFNRYPIQELSVHPRVRDDFYKGPIQMDVFRFVIEYSKNPVCYNGNLCSVRQIEKLTEEFPSLDAVMLGRGLIGNPGMLSGFSNDVVALEEFHNALLDEYTIAFGGSRNAMFRLKENWRHLLCLFDSSEKLGKKLRKTTDISEYKSITQEIFHTLPLREDLLPDW